MFPYGTQYYRAPNPPESDWETDFKRMADQGFTLVKIWAMWSWINRAEGQYDFAAFDRLFELADKNGLGIVINTILENVPYWVTVRFPDARYEASDGQKFWPIARSNTPGGGWPGLCLDNDDVREIAGQFLAAVGERYAESPVLWGYDVWNEVFFEPTNYHCFEGRHFCYCPGTRAKFVQWLQKRYGTIEALNAAWRRPYTDWGQVYPPRYLGGLPDWFDWLKFRLDSQADQMEWRIRTLRTVDQIHPMTSHGIGYTLHGMATHLTDDFQIAPLVDQWGLSSFPMGQHPSEHMRSVDLVRSASMLAGKEFWQSELGGGQTVNGLYRSAMPRGEDIAFWNWTAFMGGAKGLLYWQWRPELLGLESPGYGLTRSDGSITDRAEAAGWFARFLNQHQELADAEPVRGEMAILVLNESQILTFAANGNAAPYAESIFGIYRALWDANLQVDFTTIDHLADYPLVWLPFPLMIEEEHARRLIEYVENGGTLISDPLPGQYGDNGYASTTVPGLGLDKLFGCVEDEAEHVPDGGAAPLLQWHHAPTGLVEIAPAFYREKYLLQGGEAKARYADGAIGLVDYRFGQGKTRLIGTCPGIAYLHSLDNRPALLIRSSVMTYGGITPSIDVSDSLVKARIQMGREVAYLFALNTSTAEKTVDIVISRKHGVYRQGVDLPKNETVDVEENGLRISLGSRQGTVIRLVRSYED